MQFQHPEILYFLGLIIIPILVHLFQLQKFKKTPFTNVAFLQKLIQQSRKSSKLKKWLLLLLRIVLFTTLIIAFSQPYLSHKKAAKKQHIFIYLDNSLSLDSNGKKGNLLQNTIKEIIENSSKKETYSLLTNSNSYENLNNIELKKVLLETKKEASFRDLEEILLKVEKLNLKKTNTLNKNILISDFQDYTKKNNIDFTNVTSAISFVKLRAVQKNNLSVDSVFIEKINNNAFTVNAIIKNQGNLKSNVSIALYSNNTLVSKQTFNIKKNTTKNIKFPIQNQLKINGKIVLDFDDIFSFDNSFYFNVNTSKKSTVFSVGKSPGFLSKVYAENEFNFNWSSLQNINYNALEKQELILLNEIEEIPTDFITFLARHLKDGKDLVIIPSTNSNINSYNLLFEKLNIGNISYKISDSLRITNINFKNPFLRNVFSKEVQNFQYPNVKSHYKSNFKQATPILSFENEEHFINQIRINNGNLFWISSALNKENSNFTNSPLVVPIFYNFRKFNTKYPKSSYTIGETTTVDIATVLKKDEVLTVDGPENSFIPLQQQYASKTSITIGVQPKEKGFYTVKKQNTTIETLAFNYSSSESILNFLDIKEIIKNHQNLEYSESTTAVLQKNKAKNKVTWLWKWFLALAIVSLVFEILILKFLKP